MPKFFVSKNQIRGGTVTVGGDDAFHAVRVLRLSIGDEVVICDMEGTDFFCRIESISGNSFTAVIEHIEKCRTEPETKVWLYQAVPKGDKMEYIVQKAVELGVHCVVPVMTKRCVVRLDSNDAEKKRARWQKVALEAAKQCGRGVVPQVYDVVDFDSALKGMAQKEKAFLLYESESQKRLADILSKDVRNISFMVGPEGGFEKSEADGAIGLGIPCIGLGPRILRTETASGCVLSIIMHITGNI